jgi:ribulose-phosphate 3-epimerase
MSRRRHLLSLRQSAPAVLPSLLLCDFANLEREVRQLEAAGVAALHLDVMDGRFVQNLTYGMPIVEALRGVTDLPLDVHLMIEAPGRYVERFSQAGADIITIHLEATKKPAEVLQQISALGCGAGIALNLGTPLERLEQHESCFEYADLVLVMSVDAGFGGQSFHPVALDKLRALRGMVAEDVLLEVDGGINKETVRQCADAGAQLLVAGSAIFRQPDYSAAVTDLTTLASLA